jgi:hypothetical protein
MAKHFEKPMDLRRTAFKINCAATTIVGHPTATLQDHTFAIYNSPHSATQTLAMGKIVMDNQDEVAVMDSFIKVWSSQHGSPT